MTATMPTGGCHPSPAPTRPNRLTDEDRREAEDYALKFTRIFCTQHPRVDAADVQSGAMEGAWRAFLTWDPQGGAAWNTHYNNQVRFYALKALRVTQEGSRKDFQDRYELLSVEYLMTDSETHPNARRDSFDDIFVGDPESGRNEERVGWIATLETLPFAERSVMLMRYYLGLDCRQAAELLVGMTGGKWDFMKVWRTEKRAIKRLRGMLCVN